jgi:hypothetical protein
MVGCNVQASVDESYLIVRWVSAGPIAASHADGAATQERSDNA